MNILITGIAGFLGSHIAERLISRGHNVSGIDNLIGGYIENIPVGAEFHKFDLADLDAIKPIFKNIDIVVHAACTAYEGLSVFSPGLIIKNTSYITSNTLSAAINANVKKFIYMSSMARYGTQDRIPFTEDMVPKPQDPYGIAKYSSELLVENICKTHEIDYTILIPHNIIGPRQKYDDPYRNVVSIMINRMLQGKQPIIYGNGEQMRCFSYIDDVIDPIIMSCETDVANGRTINIGPDQEFITINTLSRIIAGIVGFDLDPIYVSERPQEVFHANCSADLARTLLGYKTKTSLDEGIYKTYEWIKQNGIKNFKYHLPIEFITEKTPRIWINQDQDHMFGII